MCGDVASGGGWLSLSVAMGSAKSSVGEVGTMNSGGRAEIAKIPSRFPIPDTPPRPPPRCRLLLRFAPPAPADCSYDYFAVSVTVSDLEKYFNKSTGSVSTAVTLTLLFRSLGALIFGVAADRYGRRWTLVVNLVLICVFELCSAFVTSYAAFLAVRCLFGIVMGGIWGQASAT